MVETYRAGTSSGGMGARSNPSASAVAGAYPAYDEDRRTSRPAYVRVHEMDERRAGSILDDVIVVLGLLVGAAGGYMAANAITGSDRRASERRQASSRYGMGGGRSSTGGSHQTASRSVEHDETTDLIASNKVESTAVYNRQGEKLGEVHNFMVGKRSGRVAYAVMSFGGFLGIGQKYHALPWSVLTYDTSKGGYVIDADRDRLMNAPTHGAGEEPFSQAGSRERIENYWASGQLSL